MFGPQIRNPTILRLYALLQNAMKATYLICIFSLLFFSCQETQQETYERKILQEAWKREITSNNRKVDNLIEIMEKSGNEPKFLEIAKPVFQVKSKRDLAIRLPHFNDSIPKIDSKALSEYILFLQKERGLDSNSASYFLTEFDKFDFTKATNEHWVALLNLAQKESDLFDEFLSRFAVPDFKRPIFTVHTQSDTATVNQKYKLALVVTNYPKIGTTPAITIENILVKTFGQKINPLFEIENYGNVFFISFIPQKVGTTEIIGTGRVKYRFLNKQDTVGVLVDFEKTIFIKP